jgi:hypothetical protein
MAEMTRRPSEEDSQVLVDEELVPLSVAATVAYYSLVNARARVEYDASPNDVMDLLALSLSQVTPLRRVGNPQVEMSTTEVKDEFFIPLCRGPQRPDLDRFVVRRRDLHAAINVLKAARVWFA